MSTLDSTTSGTSQSDAIETTTVPGILRRRADETPERPAYAVLGDGETETARLTYGELWRGVRSMAAGIHARTPAAARVLLLLPPGIDYVTAFLACLESGRVAVPAFPPPPQRAGRVRAIAADAQPALVLAARASLEAARRGLLELDALVESEWAAVEDLGLTAGDAWPGVALEPGRLAFLQYSSGSTSSPKGVRVTHANLVHNQECIRRAYGFDADSTVVSWLPPFHDMGLVGTTLQPLHVGALGVILPALAFLQKPARWLRAIERYRAHASGGPDFAYDLCARKVTLEESVGLDLSSWRVAVSGAEPVRAQTLAAFTARFAPHGFRAEALAPCYGLAEATLMASAGRSVSVRRVSAAALEAGRTDEGRPGEAAREVVSCGAPCAPGLRIVRPDTLREAAAGEVGEIWLRSPSVADGYWNRPDASAETFGARLAGSGEGPFLRTGDLGFLHAGELYVTGRLKDLIIVRGANHYPQDIEASVQRAHPALRVGGGAAFAVDEAGAERLVVVQEVEREALRGLDAAAVGESVREALRRGHELELAALVLVKPGGVPRTSSGKLQRGECRRRFLAGELPVVDESRPRPSPTGLWERLEAAALAGGTRDALVCGERALSLEALLREAEREAERLRAAGVRPGERVAVAVEAATGTLAAVLGAWRLGAAAVLGGALDDLPDEAAAEAVGTRLVVRGGGAVHEIALGERELGLYVERFTALLPEGDATLVCALRDPDAVAALEWLAALAAGGRVVFVPPPRETARGAGQVGFSLMFFSADEGRLGDDKYRLVLEGARFADRHGFEAVWTPERHFHAFGGLYPSPAVVSAALAVTTQRLRLRAGSVVLPLHHPARVVEEWAVVDNLSGGRVDLAFARGWSANDFALAPQHFACSREVLFRDLETVRRLWRGEAITLPNGHGQPMELRVHPRPRQPELNVWITCTGGPERFAETGALGANVLTGLLFQSAADLAAKLALYRQARSDHGHDPGRGRVTLMLHTFVGSDEDGVRQAVREPFIEYLRTSVDLWRHEWSQLDTLDEAGRRQVLEFAFERYSRSSALVGAPEACLGRVEELRDAGVDEIACLIDFGVPADSVLSGLAHLDELRGRLDRETGVAGPGERLGGALETHAAAAVQCAPGHALCLDRAGAARRTLRLVQGPAPAGAAERLGSAERLTLLAAAPPADAPRPRPAPAGRAARSVSSAPSAAQRELLRWVRGVARDRLAAALGPTGAQLALDHSFSQLGVDSLKGVEIVGRLSDELGVALSPTLLFEFPTVAKLSEHLVREHAPALAARRAQRRDAGAAAPGAPVEPRR